MIIISSLSIIVTTIDFLNLTGNKFRLTKSFFQSALTFDEKITPLGKALANLPVEITIGKMLLMGCVFLDTQKILTLAAAMSVQSPFTNRAFTDPKCENERKELESDNGDVFTLLNSYHEWLTMKWRSENTRKWCHKMGLEEQRFYEIAKLRNQFKNILESCNMLMTESTGDETSADRSRRHGEVQMLKSLKRAQKFQEPRKKKFLKREEFTEDSFDDQPSDIRDVDFRLSHDSNQLEILMNSCDIQRSFKDLMLLKMVICAGFYPQIAIPDEFNYCKGGTQQFFHTFLKPFVSMHPNSQFSKNFEILKLNESEISDKPRYYTPKSTLSSHHQVLCYQ